MARRPWNVAGGSSEGAVIEDADGNRMAWTVPYSDGGLDHHDIAHLICEAVNHYRRKCAEPACDWGFRDVSIRAPKFCFFHAPEVSPKDDKDV